MLIYSIIYPLNSWSISKFIINKIQGNMCNGFFLRFQTKLQLGMERGFSGWADILSKRTCLVFWISMVIFILFALGNALSEAYEPEDPVWMPSVSSSYLSNKMDQIMHNHLFFSLLG